MLKAKIQQELTQSLKEKNTEKVEVLRLLMSDIKNREIDSQHELNDDEVLTVIKKTVKKLHDALEMFKKGGRKDLVKENEQQIHTLSAYLPPEMPDEELEKAIDSLIDENRETFKNKPKAIIGIAMKKLSSKADPKRIIVMISKKASE